MMNLLVGILGANYERYEEQSQALFVSQRTLMHQKRALERRLDLLRRHNSRSSSYIEEELGQFGRDVGVLESAVQKASRLVSDLVLRIHAGGVDGGEQSQQIDARPQRGVAEALGE